MTTANNSQQAIDNVAAELTTLSDLVDGENAELSQYIADQRAQGVDTTALQAIADKLSSSVAAGKAQLDAVSAPPAPATGDGAPSA